MNAMRINEILRGEHLAKSKNTHTAAHVCLCARAHTQSDKGKEVRTFSRNGTFYIPFLSRRRARQISVSEAKEENHFKKEGAEQGN